MSYVGDLIGAARSAITEGALKEADAMLAQARQFVDTATPRRARNTTDGDTTGAGRTRRRDARAPDAAANTAAVTERVYRALPETGTIRQTAIKVADLTAREIGASLGRLKRQGRVIGEKGGPWARTATAEERQRPAA